MKQRPITNCHTHIFTGDHVAPYLAKRFLPFPFYYLLHMGWVVKISRSYNKWSDRIRYSPTYKAILVLKNRVRVFVNRFGILKDLLSAFIGLQVIFILYRYLSTWFPPEGSFLLTQFQRAQAFLDDYHLILFAHMPWMEIILVLFLLLFLPSWRNFIVFLFSKFWSFFGAFSGKQTKELARRYLNIGRYAFHQKQHTIFAKLRSQYPQGTRFVVLPMDMDYMDAGKSQNSYVQQMHELVTIKVKHPSTFFPFVFADPRRIAADPAYFKYRHSEGKVILDDCFIREFIEQHQFSGFKIYPALGYYPFETELLPLWKYAADNGLPITTHCIRGTIFYRGNKKEAWNRHPVFEQSAGEGKYQPLLLPQMDAVDYSINFTHPLNYLCLLDERLLRIVVSRCKDEKVQQLFGFTNDDTPLKHNLSHLKICFGHFGGDDEWIKFFERDRDNYSSQLVRNPGRGIDFLEDVNGALSPGKPEFIWRSVDWYTIICSLMLQFPNVYADISYILHDESAILPLLKQTLAHDGLKTKVLYGTDFFVVRNHKSDKQMLADMRYGLSEDEFDLIARENPAVFLNLQLAADISEEQDKIEEE